MCCYWECEYLASYREKSCRVGISCENATVPSDLSVSPGILAAAVVDFSLLRTTAEAWRVCEHLWLYRGSSSRIIYSMQRV